MDSTQSSLSTAMGVLLTKKFLEKQFCSKKNFIGGCKKNFKSIAQLLLPIKTHSVFFAIIFLFSLLNQSFQGDFVSNCCFPLLYELYLLMKKRFKFQTHTLRSFPAKTVRQPNSWRNREGSSASFLVCQHTSSRG